MATETIIDVRNKIRSVPDFPGIQQSLLPSLEQNPTIPSPVPLHGIPTKPSPYHTMQNAKCSTAIPHTTKSIKKLLGTDMGQS